MAPQALPRSGPGYVSRAYLGPPFRSTRDGHDPVTRQTVPMERIPVLRLDADRAAGVDLSYDADRHVLQLGVDRYRPRVAWLRSSPADTSAAVAGLTIAAFHAR